MRNSFKTQTCRVSFFSVNKPNAFNGLFDGMNDFITGEQHRNAIKPATFDRKSELKGRRFELQYRLNRIKKVTEKRNIIGIQLKKTLF